LGSGAPGKIFKKFNGAPPNSMAKNSRNNHDSSKQSGDRRKEMKTIIFGIIALLTISQGLIAQTIDETAAVEQQIRSGEENLVAAVLHRDVAKLGVLFAEDLIVNNPANRIVGKEEVIKLVKDRRISYSSYKTNIEKIVIIGTIAVVMGSETVTPIDEAPLAGKTVERRFTNIWILRNGDWQMTARHANVISSN
jgi:hypothetical protein